MASMTMLQRFDQWPSLIHQKIWDHLIEDSDRKNLGLLNKKIHRCSLLWKEGLRENIDCQEFRLPFKQSLNRPVVAKPNLFLQLPLEILRYVMSEYFDFQSFRALASINREICKWAQGFFEQTYASFNQRLEKNHKSIGADLFLGLSPVHYLNHALFRHLYDPSDPLKVHDLIQTASSFLKALPMDSPDWEGLNFLIEVWRGNAKGVVTLLKNSRLKAVWLNRALVASVHAAHLEIFNIILKDLRVNLFAFNHQVLRVLLNHTDSSKMLELKLEHWHSVSYIVLKAFKERLVSFESQNLKINHFYSHQFEKLSSVIEGMRTQERLQGNNYGAISYLKLSEEEFQKFLASSNQDLANSPSLYDDYFIGVVLANIQGHGNVPMKSVLEALRLLLVHPNSSLEEEIPRKILEEFVQYLKTTAPEWFYKPEFTRKEALSESSERYLHPFSACLPKIMQYLKLGRVEKSGAAFKFLLYLVKDLLLYDRDVAEYFKYSISKVDNDSSGIQQRFFEAFVMLLMIETAFPTKAILLAAEDDLRFSLLEQFLNDPSLNLSYNNFQILELISLHGDGEIFKKILPLLRSFPAVPYDRLFKFALHHENIEMALELAPLTSDLASLFTQIASQAQQPALNFCLNELIQEAAKVGYKDLIRKMMALKIPLDWSTAFYTAIGYAQFDLGKEMLKDPRVDISAAGSAALGWAAYYRNQAFFTLLIQDSRMVLPNQKQWMYIKSLFVDQKTTLNLLLGNGKAAALIFENDALKLAVSNGQKKLALIICKHLKSNSSPTKKQLLNMQAASLQAHELGLEEVAESIQSYLAELG